MSESAESSDGASSGIRAIVRNVLLAGMQLRASAKGWAALYLKENPHNYRRKGGEHEHRAKALAQGHVAINSILRDWVKGQLMAVETGILSFDAVFLPFMLTHDGRTISERADQLGLLPPSEAASS